MPKKSSVVIESSTPPPPAGQKPKVVITAVGPMPEQNPFSQGDQKIEPKK